MPFTQEQAFHNLLYIYHEATSGIWGDRGGYTELDAYRGILEEYLSANPPSEGQNAQAD